MIKRIQVGFDIFMLVLTLSAEGSRFFNFFLLLSGSENSAFIFAIAVSLIIVYLEISEFVAVSKISVVLCIALSVISYIKPFTKEILEVDSVKITEKEREKQALPIWKSQWESKDDKAMRKLSYLAEFEKVKKHNERIDRELLALSTTNDTKKIAFLFSAFLMSFCVPLLTYLISHKLAKEFVGVIQVKRKTEDVDNIFKKLGGTKI